MKKNLVWLCIVLLAFALGVLLMWLLYKGRGVGFNGNTPGTDIKRVVVGELFEAGTSKTLSLDKHLHIQDKSNFDSDASSKPIGFRVLCGPVRPGPNVTLKVSDQAREFGGVTFDLAPELSGGYASLWGWRPYIRLQRISAAAEGSWIIVQVVPRTNTTYRVFLIHTEDSKKVAVWDNNKEDPKAVPITSFGDEMHFVDVVFEKDKYLSHTDPTKIDPEKTPDAYQFYQEVLRKMK